MDSDKSDIEPSPLRKSPHPPPLDIRTESIGFNSPRPTYSLLPPVRSPMRNVLLKPSVTPDDLFRIGDFGVLGRSIPFKSIWL